MTANQWKHQQPAVQGHDKDSNGPIDLGTSITADRRIEFLDTKTNLNLVVWLEDNLGTAISTREDDRTILDPTERRKKLYFSAAGIDGEWLLGNVFATVFAADVPADRVPKGTLALVKSPTGTLFTDMFIFTPTPVALPPPAPPADDAGKQLGIGTKVGDSGEFTASDRALLWRIAGKLGAL